MREVKALIVSAHFYADISEHLEKDACTTLEQNCQAECFVQTVPGVFEIPTVVAMHHEKFDLVVALGAVIRGETSHYDFDYAIGNPCTADFGLAEQNCFRLWNHHCRE